MFNFQSFLPIALLVLLSACGGSSGGEGDKSGGDGDVESNAVLHICIPFDLDSANWRIFNSRAIDALNTEIDEYNLGNDTRRQVSIHDDEWQQWEHVVYSPGRERLYAFDEGDLKEIDIETGESSTISASFTNSLPLDEIYDVELDDANDLLYVLGNRTYGQNRILSIDLNSGSRMMVAINSRLTPGENFDTDMAFSGGRLFTVNRSIHAVLEVNLSTGERSLVTDNTFSGPDFDAPASLIADVSNNRLYVADIAGNFFAVDIATGESNLLSAPDYANNLLFGPESYMRFDPVNNRALMLACDKPLRPNQLVTAYLLAIDLESGARSPGYAGRGSGPHLLNPGEMAYDPARNRVLVESESSIIAVDAIGGDRLMISGPARGSGPMFGNLADVAVDTTSDRILALGYFEDEPFIFQVEPVSGDRTLLSGNNGQGVGDLFERPLGIAYDSGNDQLLVVDNDLNALFGVDLATGDRTIISRLESNPIDVAVDAVRNRAYVAVDGAASAKLYRINLSNGFSTLIIDDYEGNARSVMVNNALNVVILSGGETKTTADLVTGSLTQRPSGCNGEDLASEPASSRIYSSNPYSDTIDVCDSSGRSLLSR